ncbi:MAG: lysoplasmalogenase [Chitinophagales bacterium]|nr:lysoplasmalogenase [Chitinophagales bacterium]
MKFYRYFIVYFGLLIGQILSVLIESSQGNYILKPALMIVLGLFYTFQAKRLHYGILAGLFFSWLGDILLMGNEEIFFLSGIGCFLLAQLSYFFSFKKWVSWQIISIVLMITLTFGFYFGYIYPFVSDRTLSHIIGLYVSAITAMGIAALSMVPRNNFIALGALLFILSDALIAWDKFNSPIRLSPLWIMSTYGIAQWLIVFGAKTDHSNRF